VHRLRQGQIADERPKEAIGGTPSGIIERSCSSTAGS
jgi:hypothetical protein